MKKLVIFDLGDVCVRIYVERCNETWLRLAGRELMGDGVFDVEAGHRHERGEIAGAELWEALRGSLGLDLTDDQWKEGWNSIFGNE
ncbi:MAG: HAD family phosphatase, partial [Verrucomicrobiota bacterium]